VSGIVPTRAARAERSMVCMSVSRRDMLKFAIGAAAAVVAPMEALADGATSPATKYRVRGIYGYKIMGAGDTVNSIPGLIDSGSWVELGNLVSSAKKSPGKLYDLEGALQLFKTGYFADSRPVSILAIGVQALHSADLLMNLHRSKSILFAVKTLNS